MGANFYKIYREEPHEQTSALGLILNDKDKTKILEDDNFHNTFTSIKYKKMFYVFNIQFNIDVPIWGAGLKKSELHVL